MKIGIDIDNTVANAYEAWKPWMDKLTKTLNVSGDKMNAAQNFKGYAKNLSEKQIADFKEFCRIHQSNGSLVYPTIAGAKDVIVSLKQKGHEIYFVSARKDEYWDDAEKMSAQWLKTNGIPFDSLAVECKNKAEYCKALDIDVLIDDNLPICECAASAGIHAIYFFDELQPLKKCALNKNPNIISCGCWKDIQKTLTEIELAHKIKR